MSSNLKEFTTKFQTEELSILKLNYWTWSVRPVHATLGSGILSLNRFCTNFGDISEDEGKELSLMTKEIENRLKKSFNPSKFNYIMLMMVDNHLHFHVIPRYDRVINFGDREWKDNGWPALPQLSDGSELQNDAILAIIKNELKKN